MNEQDWISIVDYARTFNISDMTVRRRIKTGKIKAELFNGKYYIPKVEVERRSARNQRPLIRESMPPPTVAPKVRSQVQSSAFGEGPTRGEPLEASLAAQSLYFESDTSLNKPVLHAKSESPRPRAQSTHADESSVVELCKASMKLAKESEEKTRLIYEEKCAVFREREKNFERRIKSLEQKIEDLELLISVLEGQGPATRR